MPKVTLCLGSNLDAQRNIDAAKDLLRHTLSDIQFSSPLWTKPVGEKQTDRLYLNCLAEGHTDMDYPTLHNKLKNIEQRLGSTPSERQQGIVRIDIDILKLDWLRYHEDDWERDYVKRLLREL